MEHPLARHSLRLLRGCVKFVRAIDFITYGSFEGGNIKFMVVAVFG